MSDNKVVVDEFKEQSLFSLKNWSLHIDGVQIFGLINAENSLVVILIALFIGKITKRLSNRVTLYTGIFLFGLGYAVIGVSNSTYLLMLMMFVATVGELMWVPVQQSIMADLPSE